ncbi:hypothetical protein ACS0TY_033745 [Phlomoides rotata]
MANSHAKQTDFGTTLLKHNNSSTLSTHIDGAWHFSPHVNASPIMNGEETEENKCASAWSVISNHSASSSGKQFNTPVSACTDRSKTRPRASSDKRGPEQTDQLLQKSHQVQMQGIDVGRAVDLTTLKGYDDLITELEEMFEIKGELQSRNKWEVVFTDDEGDMMPVGDDPWIWIWLFAGYKFFSLPAPDDLILLQSAATLPFFEEFQCH